MRPLAAFAVVLVVGVLSGCQKSVPMHLPQKIFFPVVMMGWPNKKGLALYPGSPCADAHTIGASWQYGWWPQPARCEGIEDVPMVSCGIDALKVVNGEIKIIGDPEWIMLYNEPDHILPISPGEGAILYNRLLPIIGNRKVVAPAPSELDTDWLPRFRQAYINMYNEPPKLDALACHCYKQSVAECEALVGQFIAWANKWGIPEVWVTEFAFVDLGDARKFIAWMESEPKVTRYAWFTNRLPAMHISDAPLVDWDSGHLTAWGEMYRDS